MREPDFRRLWSAQFVSNIGSWMQTVAAHWVMLSLTTSALLVSAISAAASIPVLLLAVPAGALGDLADRKRLILATQLLMLLAAAALAVLSLASKLTPAILLALLFVIGCGTAASAPTWQTLQPELVPAANRSDAIALGSVNQNLARAIGPALGGLLLAATSAAALFAVNAVSFVAVLAAVAITAVPKRAVTLPVEHALDAARAGGRFVANSPTLLALIARATVFIFPAGATWALLPLVARHKLGLGSIGYGLLLGCVGIGALGAATFGPALRQQMVPRVLYASSAVVVAATAIVLAYSDSVALDADRARGFGRRLDQRHRAARRGLPDADAAVGEGTRHVVLPGRLPRLQRRRGPGVRHRGTGEQRLGCVPGHIGVSARGSLLTWRLALPRAISAEVEAAEPWALPEVRDPEAGPVMVSVTWPVQPERLDDFLALAGELRRLRRRTGAGSWRLYRQAEDQYELLETFIVGSWAEHERQHARMYPSDTGVLDRLDQTLLPDRPRLSFITPSPSGPDNGSSQITMDRDHSPSTRSAQRRRGLL